MPKVGIPQSGTSEPPPFEEGVYTLEITEIEENLENQYQGKPRPQLGFKFVVQDEGEYKDTEVRTWAGLSYFEGGNGKSPARLYEWCQVLGIEPEQDEDGEVYFDTDAFIGVKVTAFVEKTPNGWPRVVKLLKRA